MKLAAILSVASTLATFAHAAECDLKLNQAVALPERETCEDESGFDFGLTTLAADVIAKFCKSSACVTVWQAAKDVGLPECTIYGKQLYKDVLDPIEAACKTSAAAAVTGTSSSNSTTTKDSHDGSHSSGSVDSSDDDSAVKAPSNKTSTSTPAPPKSAGAPLASLSLASAGVVALSVAASFL